MLNVKMYKLAIVGDSSVGKTSIAKRLLDDYFDEENKMTIGAAFCLLTYKKKNGDIIKLEIWDTAGQERYSALLPMYLRGAEGVIMVFDLSERCTLERIHKYWLPYVIRNYDANTRPLLYLLGNKKDLKKGDIDIDIKNTNIKFIEVSAKTGENIQYFLDQFIDDLTTKISVRRTKLNLKYRNRLVVNEDEDEEKKNDGIIKLNPYRNEEEMDDVIENRKCCNIS